MNTLISMENLTKAYNEHRVIDGISHSFFDGESIAFTGHNGCGKSTILKLIAGLIAPTGGSIVNHRKLRFSYVPEKFPGTEISMLEYLKHIADMENVPETEVRGLISDFFMDDMIHTRMDKLSKGSLQKVGVIQAIMAPHDVLLLDEPLSGQDAESQQIFISKINDLKKQGITVFMSCHEKPLTDTLADKVYTIDHGKLVENE